VTVEARSSEAIDRAAAFRRDAETIAARLAHPEALLLPMWRNKNWVARSGEEVRPLLVPVAASASLLALGTPCFLGELGGRAVFAIELPPERELAAYAELGGEVGDLRMLGGFMHPGDASLCAYARGLLGWHKRNAYCGRCGVLTRLEEGGHVRVCVACAEKHFPRTDPAVMILLLHDDRVLLARQASFPRGVRSVLAGFVEPGETLEDAVAREAMEEVGLAVTDLRYVGSQPWPFPSSLMIGFAARATSDTITLDRFELEEGDWYTREAIERGDVVIPPPYSLAHRLIQRFLRREL
jgi:NAD+ diphosphatase